MSMAPMFLFRLEIDSLTGAFWAGFEGRNASHQATLFESIEMLNAVQLGAS